MDPKSVTCLNTSADQTRYVMRTPSHPRTRSVLVDAAGLETKTVRLNQISSLTFFFDYLPAEIKCISIVRGYSGTDRRTKPY